MYPHVRARGLTSLETVGATTTTGAFAAAAADLAAELTPA